MAYGILKDPVLIEDMHTEKQADQRAFNLAILHSPHSKIYRIGCKIYIRRG